MKKQVNCHVNFFSGRDNVIKLSWPHIVVTSHHKIKLASALIFLDRC